MNAAVRVLREGMQKLALDLQVNIGLLFNEAGTVHCLQRRQPTGITVTEILLARRLAEAPERFRVTLANGGTPSWRTTSIVPRSTKLEALASLATRVHAQDAEI